MATTTTNIGVATHLPAARTKNFAPEYSFWTGITLRTRRTARFFCGSYSSSSSFMSLYALHSRIAANTNSTAVNLLTIATPAAMKMARKTRAPMTP
jgi:hypothetical protein